MLALLLFSLVCGLWGSFCLVCIHPPAGAMFRIQLLSTIAGLGLGGVGCLLFWFSLAGWIPSLKIFCVIGIAGLIALPMRIGNWKQQQKTSPKIADTWWKKLLAGIALLVSLAALIIAFTHALGFINYEWDAYMIWGFKARILATDPCLRTAYFTNFTFALLHLDYPLMTPILMAGLYNLIGHFDDTTVKIIFPIFYLLLAGFIYSGLRQHLVFWQALALGAIYLSMPRLLRWAGSGYADVPLTAFYAGSILYLWSWVRTSDKRNLIIAALFMAFAAFTKNEGLALAGLMTLTILILPLPIPLRERIQSLIIFIMVFMLVLLPWLWFRDQLPNLNENYPAQLSLNRFIEHIDRLPVILKSFFLHGISLQYWNGMWLLLVVSTVVQGTHRFTASELLLWFLLIGHAIIYVIIYVVTPSEVENLIPVTMDRLQIHMSPSAILLIGYYWAELGKGRNSAVAPVSGGDTRDPIVAE